MTDRRIIIGKHGIKTFIILISFIKRKSIRLCMRIFLIRKDITTTLGLDLVSYLFMLQEKYPIF